MTLSGRLGTARAAKVQRRTFGLQGIWEEGGRTVTLGPVGYAVLFVSHAFRSILLSPLHALLTILTGSVVLFFMGAFLLLLWNTGSVVARRVSAEGASVFVADAASDAEVAALRAELTAMPEVQRVRFVSKEEALRRFRESLGEAASALDGLEMDNPLPASFEIALKDDEAYRAVADRIQRLPAVDRIVFDEAVLSQLSELLRTLRWAGAGGGLLLFIMMTFVIASTIRLALHADRQEIAIMRLVGARSSFVNAPFIIQGGVEGFLGGVLGVLGLYGVYTLFSHTLSDVGSLNLLFPHASFLPWWAIAGLILTGLLLGLAGSYLTVSRFGREGEVG